ncbi:MAG: hypothetical protein P1P88_04070 [Bacteroidales bacterium]|nr:hypothetical protein [Bacteroidales bacterium]
MKFLSKNPKSSILEKGLTYQKNKSDNNRLLKEELLKEQKNFCAYTEKYLQELDASEVEHFNSSIKYKDDYYNYYAILRKANLYKKDETYLNAKFFETRFFQNKDNLESRIMYKDGFYFQINEDDKEAFELIDFLGLNHPDLCQQRNRHVNRLAKTFKEAAYNSENCIEYFKEHIEEMSFVTAIEEKFDINLETIL